MSADQTRRRLGATLLAPLPISIALKCSIFVNFASCLQDSSRYAPTPPGCRRGVNKARQTVESCPRPLPSSHFHRRNLSDPTLKALDAR